MYAMISPTYDSAQAPNCTQGGASLWVNDARKQHCCHDRWVVLVEVQVCSLRAVEQVHCLLLLSRSGIGHVCAVRESLGVCDLRWLAEGRHAESMPDTQLSRLVSDSFGVVKVGGTNEAGECGNADDVAVNAC